MTGLPAAAVATPDEARDAARRILAEDRFRPAPPSRPPQPFKQPLTWLGEQLQRLLAPIGRFLSETVGAGGPVAWIVFSALLVVLVALMVRRIGHRVARRRADAVREVRRSRRIAQLEHDADAAARDGRWSEAVRLRFRAGLLWLEERGRVDAVERRPNAEVVRAAERFTPSSVLGPLAGMHDRVAYGEEPAGPADHDAALAGWREIRQGGDR